MHFATTILPLAYISRLQICPYILYGVFFMFNFVCSLIIPRVSYVCMM